MGKNNVMLLNYCMSQNSLFSSILYRDTYHVNLFKFLQVRFLSRNVWKFLTSGIAGEAQNRFQKTNIVRQLGNLPTDQCWQITVRHSWDSEKSIWKCKKIKKVIMTFFKVKCSSFEKKGFSWIYICFKLPTLRKL